MKKEFNRKIKHTQRERQIIYKCIRIIEDTLGGYNKSRHIVKQIEDFFGLTESLSFKEACMAGRFDNGTKNSKEEDYF